MAKMEEVYVQVRGYEGSLSDGTLKVFFARSIEREHEVELKTQLVPVIAELHDRLSGKKLGPVALYVVDGRNKLNLMPKIEGYTVGFTYIFVPTGLGLRPEWPSLGQ